MLSGLKIYKVKDFNRKTETGNIDLKRSKQIIRELGMAAGLHTNHNNLKLLCNVVFDPKDGTR